MELWPKKGWAFAEDWERCWAGCALLLWDRNLPAGWTGELCFPGSDRCRAGGKGDRWWSLCQIRWQLGGEQALRGELSEVQREASSPGAMEEIDSRVQTQ